MPGRGAGADDLWAECAAVLRARLPESVWQTSFAGVRPVRLDDDRLVVAVPSTLVRQRIESRHLELVSEILTELARRPTTIEVEVVPEVAAAADAAVVERLTLSATPAGPSGGGDDPVLTPNYTFDTFVIGESNQFAHAAALTVAEKPGATYNPLYIYGGTGLGKTHLLQAIGHYVREHYPNRRVRYVNTETMFNEFVEGIRSGSTATFKRRYREPDLLLIDDIQFAEAKESFQEELFHTFNEFPGGRGKQVVLTSDRSTKRLTGLEHRLRSRFEWGLTIDIQPPDLETRLAILRRKAEVGPVAIPDDVFDYIAAKVVDNIRELEGALNRVTAYAMLNREALTLPLAQRLLRDLIETPEPRQITPDAILAATTEMFGVTVEDLVGKSRSRPLVTARQIAMYVFRNLTNFSYPAIGRVFGNRDHTTVMHAVEKISGQMGERRAIYDQVTELTDRIKNTQATR